ncbi:35057_t:CDS:1, partial [Racocetra persica]
YLCNCNRRSSFEFHNQECKRRLSELDFSNQNLVGDLDLTDFYNLREVNISGNLQLGKLKTYEEGGFSLAIFKINAQDWLN